MAITVTAPMTKLTGVTLGTTAGGSLAASTTYYVRVVAKTNSNYYSMSSVFTSPLNALSSPASDELSVTTDTTNKSITVSWTAHPAITGATIRYEVYVSTTSGDYTGGSAVKYQGTATSTTITTMTSALLGSGFFTYPIGQTLPGGLSRENGTLLVTISGTAGTLVIKDVYDAVVAAGYPGYVFYDGTNFGIQGSIFISAATTGSMSFYNQHLYFLWGVMFNGSSSFTQVFGQLLTGNLTRYVNVFTILMWSIRYPIQNQQHYGTVFEYSFPNSTTNAASNYNFGGDERLLMDGVSAVYNLVTDGLDVQRTDTTGINNTTSRTIIRLNQTAATTNDNLDCAYVSWENRTYDGTIVSNVTLRSGSYHMVCRKNSVGTEYAYVRDYTLVTLTTPTISWQASGASAYPIFRWQYTYNLTVTNTSGTAISGATVTITDTTGTAISGSPFTTDGTGKISTYLTLRETANNGTAGDGAAFTTTTIKTPYTITISATGYQTRTYPITPTAKTFETQALEKVVPLIATQDGQLIDNLNKTNPQNNNRWLSL